MSSAVRPLLTVLSALAVGCGGSPSPGPRAGGRPLSADDVEADVAALVAVLDGAYAGRGFVTDATLRSLRARLAEETAASRDVAALCTTLGDAVSLLVDPGIAVWAGDDPAARCSGDGGTVGGLPYEGVSIGPGVAEGGAAPFVARIEPGEAPVALLGIRDLSSSEDPGWAGFAAAMAELASAPALVVDLRGARGNDPAPIAGWLAGIAGEQPPIAGIAIAAGPEADVLRAGARELGLPPEALALEAWRPLMDGAPPVVTALPQSITVLVDDACEEGCELVARVLRAHASATVIGTVGHRHRLSTGEPGVLVLPRSGLRVSIPLRAIVVSDALGRATGDRGAWLGRLGYGASAVREQPDALPSAIADLRAIAVYRARLAGGIELPQCASLPDVADVPPTRRDAVERLELAGDDHRATVTIALPPDVARAFLASCPGITASSAYARDTGSLVQVGFDELASLWRVLGTSLVERIAFPGPGPVLQTGG